jgi:hypothetical protein
MEAHHEPAAIYVNVGQETEGLIQAIIDEFKEEGMSEDDALDAIEIDREQAPSGGVANEPVTVAAILSFATGLTIVVARAVEKWMRNRHHQEMLKMIIQAQQSKKNVKPLIELASKFGDIEVKTDRLLPTLRDQR